MKRTLILIIAICLFTAAGFALAEEPVKEYSKNGFRITLPDGEWYDIPIDPQVTYYFGDPNGFIDNGMIMIQITPDDTLIGVTLPEDTLTQFYDSMQAQLAAGAENGTVGAQEGQMNGNLSRIFWFRGEADNSGALYSIAAVVSFVGPNNVVIMFVHPSVQPEKARDIAAAMGESLQYDETGDAGTGISDTGTSSVQGTAEFPTAENPYFFDPHSARERNLSTAMWMMDEKSRAYLTMYMMLNTANVELPYPINVMASWIGSAEDTILIAIPSQDGETACIYMYDNKTQNACFFYQPWGEAALEEFKAACTDQLFENSEDALVAIAQELLSTAGVND